MMNSFGIVSQAALQTADGGLRRVAHKVLRIKDHSILKGHRPQDEQDAAFFGKPQRSKLKWPDGKHNDTPSKAIDVQTYPLPSRARVRSTDDPEAVYQQRLREEQLYLLGLYVGIASEMGIELRTGADWDQDGEIVDNGFDDFYHVEIV